MRENSNDIHRYDDIINLPRHISKLRPHMPILDRAAQFSPFAALTGYDGAIKETARLTDRRVELDETEKTLLDDKLRILQEQLSCEPEIFITYFEPDEKKIGGAYITVIGIVNKIDIYSRSILMQDGTRIAIDEIIDIAFSS